MDPKIFCSVSFVFYIIGLGLFLAGFGGPYWLHIDDGSLESRHGLWEYCLRVWQGGWECSYIEIYLEPAWFQATVGFMILALIVAVAAGLSRMYMPISSTLEIVAGVFTLIGITVYGVEADYAHATQYLDWAFALATSAGIIFVINGTVLAIFSFNLGCDMTRQLPCESEDQPREYK